MTSFTVGAGYARFRGPALDATLHRHAAFQIAIALHTDVAIADGSGTEYRASTLVVPPMFPHRLLASPDVLTFFIEPHSAFADHLRARYGDGIHPAPELHTLDENDLAHPSACLDSRLLEALDALRTHQTPITALAAQVGLSPQRLRALARDQIGMPLARWRLWIQLHQAAESLEKGRSAATAAAHAGFADQAHLTRRLREMIGLTPAMVIPLLHPQR